MPLLGTKAFILKNSSDGLIIKRGKYFLPLTNENFDNREELDERIKFYSRKIWSCRCTGHPNLSYTESQRNENRILESLSRTFPLVFEAAVLHFVHLSKSPLPPLIDGICRMISEKLFIGEPVEFKVKKNSDIVRGKVCHSNGSVDVSNDPNLINFHQYVPDNTSNLLNKCPSYTVKLDSENKLVCNVPGVDLVRLTHVPSKENIRVFIRCNAIRFGVRPESPWVVDKEARLRAGIPDMAYPAEIEAAIRSHTVYSKNMRLYPTINSSNETAQTTRNINGDSISCQLKKAAPEIGKKLNLSKNNLVKEEPQQQMPVVIHPAVLRVFKEVEKNGIHGTHSKYLISRLAKEISAEEIENLPIEIKTKVYDRIEILEEKKMVASLSAEEKKVYLSDKIRRKMLELRIENQTCEDTELVSEFEIPEPKPIIIPENIPGYLIGEIFFVCEFYECFSRLLPFEDKITINFESMCQSLSSQSSSTFLLELMIPLIKAIILDDTFRGISFYNINLIQFPICLYSASEFARLCLQCGRINADEFYTDPEIVELVDLLKNNDFHTLTTRDQLRVIAALCHLLLDCDCVIDEGNRCNNDIKALRTQMTKYLTPLNTLNSNGITTQAKEVTSDTPPRSVFDDFIIQPIDDKRLSQREITSKIRREQIDQEKIRKQKLHQDTEEARRLQTLQKLEEKLLHKRTILTKMTRFGPLGLDKNYNRYWRFSCFHGLVVEKRWEVSEDLSEGPSSWFYYKTERQLNDLMKALLIKGNREARLLTNLKKYKEDIILSFANLTKSAEIPLSENPTRSINSEYEFIEEACKGNLQSLQSRISKAALGGVEDEEEFTEKLENSTNIQDIANCLVEVQKSVIRRFASGMYKPSSRSPESEEETKAEKEWHADVNNCFSLAQVYFLTDALDTSIQWSLSVKNARCKICRRAKEDDILMLCDGCNAAYHPMCLRPAIIEIPKGEWLCKTCTRCTRSTNDFGNSEKESARPRESKILKFRCKICHEYDSNLGVMAQCRSCQCYVHLSCHSPPIRNTKRTDWICWKCRCPSRSHVETRSSSLSSTRKRSWESSEESDDEGEEYNFDNL